MRARPRVRGLKHQWILAVPALSVSPLLHSVYECRRKICGRCGSTSACLTGHGRAPCTTRGCRSIETLVCALDVRSWALSAVANRATYATDETGSSPRD